MDKHVDPCSGLQRRGGVLKCARAVRWPRVRLSSEVHVVVGPELLCWDLQAMSGEPQQEYRICRLYCVCKKACLNRAANM